jgi:hypothetical protein
MPGARVLKNANARAQNTAATRFGILVRVLDIQLDRLAFLWGDCPPENTEIHKNVPFSGTATAEIL